MEILLNLDKKLPSYDTIAVASDSDDIFDLNFDQIDIEDDETGIEHYVVRDYITECHENLTFDFIRAKLNILDITVNIKKAIDYLNLISKTKLLEFKWTLEKDELEFFIKGVSEKHTLFKWQAIRMIFNPDLIEVFNIFTSLYESTQNTWNKYDLQNIDIVYMYLIAMKYAKDENISPVGNIYIIKNINFFTEEKYLELFVKGKSINNVFIVDRGFSDQNLFVAPSNNYKSIKIFYDNFDSNLDTNRNIYNSVFSDKYKLRYPYEELTFKYDLYGRFIHIKYKNTTIYSFCFI